MPFTGENDNDPDTLFIKQVFYGCVRYKPLLKTVLSSFYHDNSGTTLRSDYTLYMILSYLALFRLDELTFDQFKLFLMSQEPGKMHGFLSYIFSSEVLRRTVRDEWIKVYDPDFIDDEILGRVDRHKADTETLKSSLSTLGT